MINRLLVGFNSFFGWLASPALSSKETLLTHLVTVTKGHSNIDRLLPLYNRHGLVGGGQGMIQSKLI